MSLSMLILLFPFMELSTGFWYLSFMFCLLINERSFDWVRQVELIILFVIRLRLHWLGFLKCHGGFWWIGPQQAHQPPLDKKRWLTNVSRSNKGSPRGHSQLVNTWSSITGLWYTSDSESSQSILTSKITKQRQGPKCNTERITEMAVSSSPSVLSTSPLPRISPNSPRLEARVRSRVSIQTNLGSTQRRDLFRNLWRLNAAGLSEIEPDLIEDPVDRWNNNGISSVCYYSEFLFNFDQQYCIIDSSQDFQWYVWVGNVSILIMVDMKSY